MPPAPGSLRHPQRSASLSAGHYRNQDLRRQGRRRSDPDPPPGIMTTATFVIVGAGQAGGWAAKTLRDQGFSGRIVLYGSEAHPPYERPPLSKGVIAGS